MSFEVELKAKSAWAETVIKRYLPLEDGLQRTVLCAMNYSILAGGKRLRPIFMQETYRLYGGSGTEIEPFMAAMEMIHTSSLVHDDLPCMDNDEYRRGKKTTWKVFGEDMGTLAGDALLLYAFETASEAFAATEHPELVGQCIRILANKSGIFGMYGGQTADLEATGKKAVTLETLEFIYRLKTGALLEASMMIGACLGGASGEEVGRIEGIASDIGLAFQIQDDILDVTGTMDELGKPVYSDEKNEKTTYVTLLGLEEAKKQVEIYSRRALEGIDGLSGKNQFLNQLVETLIYRKK